VERVGGQAVFRGVMLRGAGSRWAVAVRRPDGGIETMTADLPDFAVRWRDVPLARGIVALAEALPLGARALRWSAEHGIGQPVRPARWWEKGMQALIVVAVVAVVVGAPIALAELWLPTDVAWAVNLVEGALGLAFLIGYLAVLSRIGEVRTLFEYHGAEHKVVSAFEAGIRPVTPEAAAPFSTRHTRCGTSFLLAVGIVSSIVYVLLGRPDLPLLVLSRVAVIPVVAALAAELQLRAADAATCGRRWALVLLRPGLALQSLTTREPSPDQLEVACAALAAVTADEREPART
jgi:uncharacterized protein YqhQ